MPGLRSTLANYDLDFLTRIARRWGVQISQREVESARQDLLEKMLDTSLFEKVLESLDDGAARAWNHLVQKGGKIHWAEFSRIYGQIRDYGRASREREEPDLHPVSAAETLWYAGLAGRAFLRTEAEPKEFFYIPDELLEVAKNTGKPAPKLHIRPSVNQKPKWVARAEALLPDRVTDILAALRMRREIPAEIWNAWDIPRDFLYPWLREVGLVDDTLQPVPEALKEFFNATRGQVLTHLYQVWLKSNEINELRLLPGLEFEGTWKNDPIPPRRLLTEILAGLESGTWWSLSSLLATIKETNPDFQRQGGDYESWYIRETKSSAYLSGFENWEKVEGALLTYLLGAPLHWLGIVNLARAGENGKIAAFQLNEKMKPLLDSGELSGSDKENRVMKIRDRLLFSIPNFAPRLPRYQVARFCELVHVFPKESLYALKTDTLKKAEEQGLRLGQLIQLLEREKAAAIPENLRVLEERWSQHGQEAVIERVLLLRFTREDARAAFLKQATGRFALETLDPLCVVINEKQVDGILRLLNELGILAEIAGDV